MREQWSAIDTVLTMIILTFIIYIVYSIFKFGI